MKSELECFGSDLISDFHPVRWLSTYRRTSIKYMLVMVIFYHLIGIILVILGTALVQSLVTNYKEPIKPITVTSVIFAGPIEESLFFGIPLYATGNSLIMLGGGILWAMWHLFGPNVQLSSLAYANWLFVIPSIFLSFRTWLSGKGWFAIIAHSSWNSLFFSLGCASGEIPCKVFYDNNAFSDIVTVTAAAALILITYVLYRGKNRKLKYVY